MDTADPQYFINRELSWLAFNERVLADAKNTALPLFERLKFLSIVSSNLDEFFMVRVAGLKQQILGGVADAPADGMLAPAQFTAISEQAHHAGRGPVPGLARERQAAARRRAASRSSAPPS